MSRVITHTEWLRRLSDYHNGGGSATERATVEEHLASCQECQKAFARYRRFYHLLSSPLQLGPPSPRLDEETTVGGTFHPSWMQSGRAPRPPRRSRALAGIAAVLAATLIVAGFVGVYATRNSGVASAPTSTPHATANSTTTPAETASASVSSFICANPDGSHLAYAYTRGDGQAYMVTGCAQPQQIPLGASAAMSSYSRPIAWSPGNHYLAVETSWTNQTYPVVIYAPDTGKTVMTRFVNDYPPNAAAGTVIRRFLGWVDDNTFLGALQPVVGTDPLAPFGPSEIVTVDVASQTEKTIGTITWFAGTQIIAPGYLFYAGYQSKSEGQAYLHRLNLSTGADTRFVALGEYGNGGCQVTNFCNWTAPWVVTPDGVNVIYHNPAPTGFPSDTGPVADTPLVFAKLDGSNPSHPFGTALASTLTAPDYSLQGRYVILSGVTDRQTSSTQAWFRLAQIGGSMTDVEGAFDAFRSDNQAMVVSQGDTVLLYDLNTHTTTPLELDSGNYLWAN